MRHPPRDQRKQSIVAGRSHRCHIGQLLHQSRLRKQNRKSPGTLGRHPVNSAAGFCRCRASLGDQSVKIKLPLTSTEVGTSFRKRDQRVQDIVEFIGIAHVRPAPFPPLPNCGSIHPPPFFEHRFREHPPHLHGTCPPLFKRRV